MRVLPLGGYDAILATDWIKKHGQITGDWTMKTLQVSNGGKEITLKGVPNNDTIALRELPIEQLAKWSKGNEIWEVAVVQPETEHQEASVAEVVQSVLIEFVGGMTPGMPKAWQTCLV
jgi:hypothetical protein